MCREKYVFEHNQIIHQCIIFRFQYSRLYLEVFIPGKMIIGCSISFYSKSINPSSYFPIGVLQFKLFIFAVWVLDWIRVRVQFNLNQRRKLESRGGNAFDMTIKKYSFGHGSRPMAAQVYRKRNFLTLQGIRQCRKMFIIFTRK